MAAMLPDRADVVVIGAGLAGLRTARALAGAGASVVVLEARDRVGGRTLSQPIGKGVFDLGGQWLGPGQDRVAALARELGVSTFLTYHQGAKVLDLHGRVSTYKRNIPSLSLPALLRTHLMIHRLDRMARTVPLDNPAAARHAVTWDGESLEGWKRRHVRSAPVRDLLDVATRLVFGAEPGELSLLHFLFYLHAGGGLKRLVEIDKGAQQLRFVGGAQGLALGMAAGLGERVQLGAAVNRIEQDDLGLTVESSRGRVRARYAVVAVPPPLAGRIAYQPALPAARDQLTQRAPMGSAVKCLITYERPFWRERGFSGEVVAAGSGPISAVFDNSSHDNAQPALLAFVVGRTARAWERRSASDRRRSVLAALARWFGPEASSPTEYLEHDWSAEPWTRGCPVGVIPPGVLTSFGTTLRQAVGRIHFAGTETATEWNGYMEGALESGERAARELMRRL